MEHSTSHLNILDIQTLYQGKTSDQRHHEVVYHSEKAHNYFMPRQTKWLTQRNTRAPCDVLCRYCILHVVFSKADLYLKHGGGSLLKAWEPEIFSFPWIFVLSVTILCLVVEALLNHWWSNSRTECRVTGKEYKMALICMRRDKYYRLNNNLPLYSKTTPSRLHLQRSTNKMIRHWRPIRSALIFLSYNFLLFRV